MPEGGPANLRGGAVHTEVELWGGRWWGSERRAVDKGLGVAGSGVGTAVEFYIRNHTGSRNVRTAK